jgi:hypothetical protein
VEKRRAMIEKAATIKINTGSFENLEIFESVKIEIDFADAEELRRKDDALTRQVVALLKGTAERTLKETNRKRFIGNQAVELW